MLRSVKARAERVGALGWDFEAEPKEDVDQCNLCGSDELAIISQVDRYGLPSQSAACTTCSLTFLNPRMTRDAYSGFYTSIYRPLVSAFHGRTINSTTIQAEQLDYGRRTAAYLQPFVGRKSGATLLDIGGSTGVVAGALADAFDLRASVLDPSPSELAEARKSGLETIEALAEDWDPGDRKFDVVGMFQTIDHLLDVRSTLEKARRIVRSDGIFVVDILDFRAVYLSEWSVDAALKVDHPFALTELTAECFLRRAGFAVRRKIYSVDRHVAYVCSPNKPTDDALPSPDQVGRFFSEIRYVQYAPEQGAPT